MKAEYINPFIEASMNIFKTLLSAETTVGQIYLKNSPYTASDMIIMIGVVGDMKGQVTFEITMDTAKKIISVMMGGVTVDEIDQMGQSAIGELGNMIMGNASTVFSKNNLNIDITPPTVLTGENINISNKVTTIGVPIIIDKYGVINLNITAEKAL